MDLTFNDHILFYQIFNVRKRVVVLRNFQIGFIKINHPKPT